MLSAYGLAFIGGLLTGFSPCVLPFFPVIIGYVAYRTAEKDFSRSQGFILSVAFVIGFSAIFTLLGASASFIGGFLRSINRFLFIGVGLVFLVVGLHFMKVFQLNIPSPFRFNIKKPHRKGILGAAILGILLGLVLTPCATPVVTALLAYVTAKGSVWFGASLLFVYGIAHGLPLVIVGTSTAALGILNKVQRWRRVIEIASGILFIVLGLYFLLQA